MGKMRVGLVTLVGGAVGVTAVLAYRISQEMGKPFTEALGEVPAEAQRYWEEIRSRGEEAYTAGREAAWVKQAEVEERLRGDDTFPPSNPVT